MLHHLEARRAEGVLPLEEVGLDLLAEVADQPGVKGEDPSRHGGVQVDGRSGEAVAVRVEDVEDLLGPLHGEGGNKNLPAPA